VSLNIRLTSTYEVETGVLLCPFAPLRGTEVVFVHIATAAQNRNSAGQHPKIPDWLIHWVVLDLRAKIKVPIPHQTSNHARRNGSFSLLCCFWGHMVVFPSKVRIRIASF